MNVKTCVVLGMLIAMAGATVLYDDCKLEGKAIDGRYTSTAGVATIEECYESCVKTANCLAISWSASTKLCYSYTEILSILDSASFISVKKECVEAKKIETDCVWSNSGRFDDGAMIAKRDFQSMPACMEWCKSNPECVNIVVSPEDSDPRECFLLKTTDVYRKDNWSSYDKTCFVPCSKKPGMELCPEGSKDGEKGCELTEQSVDWYTLCRKIVTCPEGERACDAGDRAGEGNCVEKEIGEFKNKLLCEVDLCPEGKKACTEAAKAVRGTCIEEEIGSVRVLCMRAEEKKVEEKKVEEEKAGAAATAVSAVLLSAAAARCF